MNKRFGDALIACREVTQLLADTDEKAIPGYILLSHLHTQLGRYKRGITKLLDSAYPCSDEVSVLVSFLEKYCVRQYSVDRI